jgi:hypothetical protein
LTRAARDNHIKEFYMALPVLGIDIAKLKFNACLINPHGKLKHKVFANTDTGFEQLAAWLVKQAARRAHACMEATGAYGGVRDRSPLTPALCHAKDIRAVR